MGILDKIKKILPKRKPPEPQNNVPKEKENIRKTFGLYCNANHGTTDNKLCPKCTALLTTVMLKIKRCPYGISKPICDSCETPCFGEVPTREFRSIMKSGQKKMLLSHPLMAVRHKLAGLGADYAKMQRDKKSTEKQKEQEEKVKAKFENAFKSPKKSKKRKKK
mgnify:CR=1 FL=1